MAIETGFSVLAVLVLVEHNAGLHNHDRSLLPMSPR